MGTQGRPRKDGSISLDALREAHRRWTEGRERITRLAAELGVHDQTLYLMFWRTGLPSRENITTRKLSDAVLQDAHQRYWEGEAVKEMAHSLGVTNATLYNRWHGLGLPIRARGYGRGFRGCCSRTPAILRDLEDRQTAIQVARKHGVSRARVYQIVEQAKQRGDLPEDFRPAKNPPKPGYVKKGPRPELLGPGARLALYRFSLGYSRPQVAKWCGVSYPTMFRYVQRGLKHGTIVPRPDGDYEFTGRDNGLLGSAQTEAV